MAFYNYQKSNNKRISLLGMSGVGKTHLANILRQTGDWFHYSGDYRIGSRYLDEPILDNIRKTMIKDDLLRQLLLSDALYIGNNISFDNLLSVSSFLGKLGNPKLGALPFDEFNKRQALHAKAEEDAMLDVPNFIEKSQHIYDCNNFVNDAGGSLCELDDSIIAKLAKHTLLIYLKTSVQHEKILISRAISNPKPMYYHPDFLKEQLQKYLTINNLEFVAQINPNDFSTWVFEKLLYYRLPKYEALAKKYGITIASDDLYKCNTANDFFILLEKHNKRPLHK